MKPPNATSRMFYSEEDGGYIVEDLTRPGCCAFGKTRFEAQIELLDARRAGIVSAEERGLLGDKNGVTPKMDEIERPGIHDLASRREQKRKANLSESKRWRYGYWKR